MKFCDSDQYSFLAIERVGNSRFRTPEGYLLCPNVRIARVGDLEYDKSELDGSIRPDSTGKIVLSRSPEDFFTDQTISSFEGKPLIARYHRTIAPDNYQSAVVGSVSHVRKEGDYLVADLMICDADTISLVEDNIIREISIGYDADTEETGIGRGRQFNIIGNHVALVREGRAGPTCAIGDSKFQEEVNEANMSKSKTRKAVGDSLEIEMKNADATSGNEDLVTFGAVPTPTPAQDPDAAVKVEVNVNNGVKPAAEGDAGEAAATTETTVDVPTNAPAGDDGANAPVSEPAPTEPSATEPTEIHDSIATLEDIKTLDDFKAFVKAVVFETLKEMKEKEMGDSGGEGVTETPGTEKIEEAPTSTEAVVMGDDCNVHGDEITPSEAPATTGEPATSDDGADLPTMDELAEGVSVITPGVELSLGDAPTKVVVRDVMLDTIAKYRRTDAKMDSFLRTLFGKFGDSLDKLDSSVIKGIFFTIKEACKVNNNRSNQFISHRVIGDGRISKPSIRTAKDLSDLYKKAHDIKG